jgi:hypothetical protein
MDAKLLRAAADGRAPREDGASPRCEADGWAAVAERRISAWSDVSKGLWAGRGPPRIKIWTGCGCLNASRRDGRVTKQDLAHVLQRTCMFLRGF